MNGSPHFSPSPARSLLAALAILLALPVQALAADQMAIGARTVRDDMFPRIPVPFANGVVAYPDIEYANLVGYRPLLLDLYMPPKSAAPRPLVLWIHGGSWKDTDSRVLGAAVTDPPATLALLASRGYVVASVNYRLRAEALFPAQIQDVKAAIRFLRANAAKYNIDPGRVVIWGGSAGGYLAALAATSCGAAEYNPLPNDGRPGHDEALAAKLREVSDCLQGAVIWYGRFNLQGAQDPDVDALLGCAVQSCAARAAAASPINRISQSTPPMLLIHGLADTGVSSNESSAMAQKLEQAGVPVQLLLIPGVDHLFIGKTPEATRTATLQALQRTFDYIDALFAKK